MSGSSDKSDDSSYDFGIVAELCSLQDSDEEAINLTVQQIYVAESNGKSPRTPKKSNVVDNTVDNIGLRRSPRFIASQPSTPIGLRRSPRFEASQPNTPIAAPAQRSSPRSKRRSSSKIRHKRHDFWLTVKGKILVVQEAYSLKEYIHKTAAKYKIFRKSIRYWKDQLEKLKAKAIINPKALTIHIGRKVEMVGLEERLNEWVLSERERGIIVTTEMIISRAIVLDEDGKFIRKTESMMKRWVYSFLDRYALSLRRITRVGQKLSGHLDSVRIETCQAIHKRFAFDGTLPNLPLKYFINMDQTAVYFESKAKTTVDKRGKKVIHARDSASNDKRATVCVTVAADGTKLPLFYVFKGVPGATIDKALDKKGYCACVQPKAWFDTENVAQKYFDAILKPYLMETQQSLLLVDHFKAHLTGEFRRIVENLGCDLEFIPPGYTCVLQPVDVGVNAPFKKGIRTCHHNWCLTNYRGVENDQKLPVPNRDDIIEWCETSYEKISNESIRKTFVSIGLVQSNRSDDVGDNEVNEGDDLAGELENDFAVEEDGITLLFNTLEEDNPESEFF